MYNAYLAWNSAHRFGGYIQFGYHLKFLEQSFKLFFFFFLNCAFQKFLACISITVHPLSVIWFLHLRLLRVAVGSCCLATSKWKRYHQLCSQVQTGHVSTEWYSLLHRLISSFYLDSVISSDRSSGLRFIPLQSSVLFANRRWFACTVPCICTLSLASLCSRSCNFSPLRFYTLRADWTQYP